MTVVSDMVDALIAAGTPPGLAASVVTEAFAAGAASVCHVTTRDESVTNRRESDRLRKQRSRDRLVTNRDVTGQSQDASLSKSNLKEEREGNVTPVRGQRLPDDWAPTAADWGASFKTLGGEQTAAELLKFRDHYRQQSGSKGLSLDWDASWRNWIRRAEEYAGRTKPASATSAPPSGPGGFTLQAWEQILISFKKFGRWSRDAGPEPPSAACRCPPELLAKYGIPIHAEHTG